MQSIKLRPTSFRWWFSGVFCFFLKQRMPLLNSASTFTTFFALSLLFICFRLSCGLQFPDSSFILWSSSGWKMYYNCYRMLPLYYLSRRGPEPRRFFGDTASLAHGNMYCLQVQSSTNTKGHSIWEGVEWKQKMKIWGRCPRKNTTWYLKAWMGSWKNVLE